jgi:hypothetical protein
MEQANSYFNMYNIPSRFIPIEFGCKDFTDLIKKIGVLKAMEEINHFLNN